MGMLTKIAATLIGTRVAAATGKSGLLGVAAGALATRVITRSPMGALLIGGAYLGHKLWFKKQDIDAKGPHKTAVDDGAVEPGEHPLQEIEAKEAAKDAAAATAVPAPAPVSQPPATT